MHSPSHPDLLTLVVTGLVVLPQGSLTAQGAALEAVSQAVRGAPCECLAKLLGAELTPPWVLHYHSKIEKITKCLQPSKLDQTFVTRHATTTNNTTTLLQLAKMPQARKKKRQRPASKSRSGGSGGGGRTGVKPPSAEEKALASELFGTALSADTFQVTSTATAATADASTKRSRKRQRGVDGGGAGTCCGVCRMTLCVPCCFLVL